MSIEAQLIHSIHSKHIYYANDVHEGYYAY